MDLEKIYEAMINHFQDIVTLTTEEIDVIKSKSEVVFVNKKDFLLEEGKISNHMRFIVQGSMYVYTIGEDGKEHINQLCLENWWINDLYSYLKRTPSEMFIQANEDSIVIRISKENLEELFIEIPALSEFWRIKIQNAYVMLQERVFQSNVVNSYAKYATFVAKYPTMEQRFPQYMIASFLGISVEYLSALRKNYAKNSIS